jgi:hypothetical protein
MKATILLAILFFSIILANGQTRTIYGRVIDEELAPVPAATIRTPDKTLVGETDTGGRFKVEIPQNTQALLFSWIGYEPAAINLNNCDTVEVVLMASGTYDFMSSKKIDKLRLRRFNKLPELHLQAYKKGIFNKEAICYTREFHPEKSEIDSIGKELIQRQKETKLAFRKLNIGDTVRIPFSDAGGYRADGTDRTTLIAYISGSRWQHYSGCAAKCIVTDKYKRRRAYNIVCKVVSCGGCSDPSVFEGRVMQAGEVFTYNMRNFAILDNTSKGEGKKFR